MSPEDLNSFVDRFGEENKQRIKLLTSRQTSRREYNQQLRMNWAYHTVAKALIDLAHSVAPGATVFVAVGDHLATTGFGHFPTPTLHIIESLAQHGAHVTCVYEAYTSKRQVIFLVGFV
jgi:hypothetical protein